MREQTEDATSLGHPWAREIHLEDRKGLFRKCVYAVDTGTSGAEFPSLKTLPITLVEVATGVGVVGISILQYSLGCAGTSHPQVFSLRIRDERFPGDHELWSPPP